jgi:hypothetical protein
VKQGKYIYYRNQNLRSSCKVNISEKQIEESIVEKLKEYHFPANFYGTCLLAGKDLIDSKNQSIQAQESELNKEIELLKDKEKRLIN